MYSLRDLWRSCKVCLRPGLQLNLVSALGFYTNEVRRKMKSLESGSILLAKSVDIITETLESELA